MDDGLYTNRSSRSDFVQNAILGSAEDDSDILIASAFFTDHSVIEQLLERKCTVRLIVRLGFPTSPKALRHIFDRPGVQIRYFTDHSFHAKLFILGDCTALIGSANLTRSGVLTNQEIMVSIPTDDQRFEELCILFNEYWSDAKVLTDEDLKEYEKLAAAFPDLDSRIGKFDESVLKRLGRIMCSNIQRDPKKPRAEELFYDRYSKSYQESIAAFNVVRMVYESLGSRKVSEDSIPLRIEIDSFISFVRERHAQGETWRATPIQTGEPQRMAIRRHITEWLDTDWPHFEDTIVRRNYPNLTNTFESRERVLTSDDESLLTALSVIHSFSERLRFFEGGLATLKQEFLRRNDREKIRRSLAYLIFGKDEVVRRMANLIFNPDYKLDQFGRANVQELIGWVSREGLPVINGRTTKVLGYFGFRVTQI